MIIDWLFCFVYYYEWCFWIWLETLADSVDFCLGWAHKRVWCNRDMCCCSWLKVCRYRISISRVLMAQYKLIIRWIVFGFEHFSAGLRQLWSWKYIIMLISYFYVHRLGHLMKLSFFFNQIHMNKSDPGKCSWMSLSNLIYFNELINSIKLILPLLKIETVISDVFNAVL